jgi:integrase
MPTPRRSSLETPTARLRLPIQKKPRWQRLGPGLSIGYRRNAGPGTWSIRAADGKGGEWLKKFGVADDYEPADGRRILNYVQAVDQARKLIRAGDAAVDEGKPLTVADALTLYESDLKTRGANFRNARAPLKHLSAGLLAMPITLITVTELRRFRDGMLAAVTRGTANRTASCVRAACNLAAERDPRIALNRRAWDVGLQALPDATEVRNVILSDDEIRALIAAAYSRDRRFGLLVDVLAITGSRTSQVLRLAVGDLIDGAEPKLFMSKSANGGGRNRAGKKAERYSVPITPELAAKLKEAALGLKPDVPLIDASAWGAVPGAVFRRLVRESVSASGLDPGRVTLYSARHSSIVRMLLNRVPIRLVASLHDTSTKEIERHYS